MMTDKFLRLQSIYFHILGFDILKRCGRRNIIRNICGILSVGTFLPITIAFGVHNINNLEKLIDTLCHVLIDLLALFKICLLTYLYEDFQSLIQRFRKVLDKECLQSICDEIVQKENQRDQFISKLYHNCFLSTGIAACLLPLLNTLSLYWRTGHFDPEMMPSPSIFPWNNEYLFNYMLSYLWNITAALGVVLPTVCMDTLFCSLTHNLCALFKIVQYKMLHFEGENLEKSVENLSQIFHLYEESLKLGHALNGYFRPLIFTEFVVASLHLCVLSLQLSNNFMQPVMLFYATFIISILGQVSIYCYCGERVKEESKRFSYAIYDSNWSGVCNPGRIGRLLQISMMRAQRGIHIDGYFFEANFATLLSIVHKAGSYITLLRSVT